MIVVFIPSFPSIFFLKRKVSKLRNMNIDEILGKML